jgi:hypothetical protein
LRRRQHAKISHRQLAIREKCRLKNSSKLVRTENFSTHWAEFSAKGLAKVTDFEAYVKKKLVTAGDSKDLRKKIVSTSMVI